MHYYSLHGGILESEVELPGLDPQPPSGPDWTLRVTDAALETHSFRLLGERTVDSVTVRLLQSDAAYQLQYSDTGSYLVDFGGREILWSPGPYPDPKSVRSDVSGAVVALALLASNTLCLHSSAIALRGLSIAFVGPSGHGKSTLALACTLAGATLVTDDMLGVDICEAQNVRPGVRSVRLWSDSYESLGGTALPGTQRHGLKTTLESIPEVHIASDRTLLAAVYVLKPLADENQETPIRRTPLGPVESVLALVANSKLGPVLGAPASSVLLRQARDLARTTPVYDLEYARDFEALPSVVQQLLAWHLPPDQTRSAPPR